MTSVCSHACRHATTKRSRCRCVGCQGRLHGTGLDDSVYVDALIDAYRRGLHRVTDDEIVAAAW